MSQEPDITTVVVQGVSSREAPLLLTIPELLALLESGDVKIQATRIRSCLLVELAKSAPDYVKRNAMCDDA